MVARIGKTGKVKTMIAETKERIAKTVGTLTNLGSNTNSTIKQVVAMAMMRDERQGIKQSLADFGDSLEDYVRRLHEHIDSL
jgi:hypothetical protein